VSQPGNTDEIVSAIQLARATGIQDRRGACSSRVRPRDTTEAHVVGYHRPDGAHDRTDNRTLADQRYDALIARIDKNQAIADQRHTQIMAQFEKLLAKPSEN
jgi:hypothetical protein